MKLLLKWLKEYILMKLGFTDVRMVYPYSKNPFEENSLDIFFEDEDLL